MMKKFTYNRILMLAIAIGLVAALMIAGQRHAVEIHNSQVDMAMDYDSLKNLAEREGLDFADVLKQFKDAGITSLAIYDTNFDKLTRAGKVIAVYGRDIITNYHSGALNSIFWRQAVDNGYIRPDCVYIMKRDDKSYDEVKAELIQRFGEDRISAFSINDENILEVKAQFGAFMGEPMGFDSDELDAAKNAGFTILARPKNFYQCTAENVKSVFERLDGYPISEIVFDGPEILGAPKSEILDVTVAEFNKRGYIFGVIEHTSQLQFYNQLGMPQLADGVGYNKIARLYAVPRDEQPRLSIDILVNRWSTTDRERNIRINLLRIFEKPDTGKTLLETNLQYVKETADKLKADGFTFGKAGTFENYYPHKFLRVLVIIGVVAAGILYLSLVSYWLNANQRLQLILFAAISILASIPIFIGNDNLIRVVAALASANLFPALAIIWQLDRLRFIKLKDSVAQEESELSTWQIILVAAITLLITSAMSMIGAAYLSGALSDVRFFLEFEIFRGIKLTFIMPLVLVAAAFLQRFNIVDEARKNLPALEQLKEILNMNITVKALLGFLLVAAVFVVLIARSGHTSGMPVSGAEIKIRAMLEQMFYARPRSKEIFIGHPAFILAIAAFLKQFPKSICFALTLVATIGQSSMVETFAHMRTPIFMSFMRGLDGVLPGALIGVILVLAIIFVSKGVSLKSQ